MSVPLTPRRLAWALALAGCASPASAPAGAALALDHVVPRLTGCYGQGLQSDFRMAGTLDWILSVGPNGEVTPHDPRGPGSVPANVVACLTQGLAAVQLRAGAGGATLSVRVTLTPMP